MIPIHKYVNGSLIDRKSLVVLEAPAQYKVRPADEQE